MLLVCRFVVPDSDPAAVARFTTRAQRALELLSAAPGCHGGELGRSVDAPDRWVLAVRFVSVHAYRRALSPFEVREHVVPLLSDALADEPAAYEVLLSAVTGEVTEQPSLLAEPGTSPGAASELSPGTSQLASGVPPRSASRVRR